MGNCFTLPASPSLYPSSSSSSSSSSSASSSSRLNSDLCSISSESSAGSSRCAPRRILPFATLSDLHAQYHLGRELGRGEFGVIRLCTCRKSNTLFACKSISKLRMQHLPDILREVRIMQRLSRLPSVEGSDRRIDAVRLYQVIEDASHVHLIMELCNGGELFDRIVRKKCCPEHQAAAIVKSLMQSIEVCHRMGIMHRDIKPENILFVDKSESSPIRLADFGLALEFSPGEKFSGMAGSAYYIAPEVLQGEYSEEIDIWSAGVVLYVMLSGVPPFWGETEKDIFEAIRKNNLEFSFDPWRSISFAAKDLISGMLRADARARLTAAQVLEHPWILQHTQAPKQELQKICQRNTSIRSEPALKTHEPALKTHEPANMQKELLAVAPILPIPCDVNIDQEIMTSVSRAGATPCSSPPIRHFEDHVQQKLASHAQTSGNIDSQNLQKSPDLQSKTLCSQTFEALNVDASVKMQVEALSMALVAKLNVKCLPAELNVQVGWSCALLSVSPTEQIFAVEVGKKSYLISYDSRRKMGWKILCGQDDHKGFSSSLLVTTTQPRPVAVV